MWGKDTEELDPIPPYTLTLYKQEHSGLSAAALKAPSHYGSRGGRSIGFGKQGDPWRRKGSADHIRERKRRQTRLLTRKAKYEVETQPYRNSAYESFLFWS